MDIINKKDLYMKKLTAILLLTIGLASSAMAHHPAPVDQAGSGIPDNSGHWDALLGGM